MQQVLPALERLPLGTALMLFQIDLSDPAITVHPTWDMLGMWATRGDDVEYHGLFVPDDALVHSLPIGHFDARVLETVFAWALPAFGAVYIGIAQAALGWVLDLIRRRDRTGDPAVVAAVTEAEILLESGHAMYTRPVRGWHAKAPVPRWAAITMVPLRPW